MIPALTKGGAERVVVDLANEAACAGHEVTIITAVAAPPQLNASRLHPNIHVLCLSGRSVKASYLRVAPWLYRNRGWIFALDIIHCHLTFGSVFGSGVQTMCRFFRRNSPAVIETYHAVGMAIPARERVAHAFLLRARRAVVFMADDPYWRRYADRHGTTLFRTIPNGIAPLHRATAGEIDHYRAKLTAIPRDARVIGTVSRLVSDRRPDLLIDAFTHVTSAVGTTVHMLLAGEGPERPKLESMVRRRNIAALVHMPGLALNAAEPISLLDLFITVNVGSTTGIAALEAAFLGVPVIAIQLQNGYSASEDDWIWSSSDPAEVGSKIVELLTNRSELLDLALRQQARARDRFSVGAMASAYEEFYSAALGRQNALP